MRDRHHLITFTTGIAFITACLMTIAGPAAGRGGGGGSDQALNHASYWGDDCYKIDHGVGDDGDTWVSDGDYRRVILKAALVNDVFDDVRAGDALTTSNRQAISHYIVCTGSTATTTTLAPPTTAPTTTLAPPTTAPRTTVAPTTTTEPPAVITSIPSTTTTTVAPTTTLSPSTTTTTVAVTTTTISPTTTTEPQGATASTPPVSDDDGGSTGSTTQLAFTGADVTHTSLFALVALVLGSALLWGNRLLTARQFSVIDTETTDD